MIHYKIDPSSTSYVGVCREPDCGFRALSSTKLDALRARDAHAALMHNNRGRKSCAMRTFPRIAAG
ncbi:MAG: hypothetical protein QM582_14035 [Micropruina sp.]|uniref:hypothetical protein n=1 Tax=Micropruina sp. TaxID=2737536 RepID=UPI0039E2220C